MAHAGVMSSSGCRRSLPIRRGGLVAWLFLLIAIAAGGNQLGGATAHAAPTVNTIHSATTAAVDAYDLGSQHAEPRVSPVRHAAAALGRGHVGTARSILSAADVVAAEAGGAVLRPSSLADEVANATGGVLKANKGGYTVQVPYGNRGITVRVMEQGGGRTNYYRVSVPGKETYTVTGEASTDAALTHMDIGGSSLNDILSIIARIQGGG